MTIFEGLHCCSTVEGISAERDLGEERGKVPEPMDLHHKAKK